MFVVELRVFRSTSLSIQAGGFVQCSLSRLRCVSVLHRVMVGGGVAVIWRSPHHRHHGAAPGSQEAPHQDRGDDEENDVEPGRVVPGDRPRRRKKLPPRCTDMSTAAWPSTDPATPLSAFAAASRTSFARNTMRNSRATITMMMGPPKNWARVNCHPISNSEGCHHPSAGRRWPGVLRLGPPLITENPVSAPRESPRSWSRRVEVRGRSRSYRSRRQVSGCRCRPVHHPLACVISVGRVF